jgi:hypothetical protein
VGIGVFGQHVVTVGGGHQGRSRGARQIDEAGVGHLLLGQAGVPLDLHVDVFPTEQVVVGAEDLGGTRRLPAQKRLGDGPAEVGGQRQQSLAVSGQGRQLERRCLAGGRLEVGFGNQAHEIAIALGCPSQQHQMTGTPLRVVDHAQLAAQDGLDVLLLAVLLKIDGAVKIAMIRHRHGRHAQLGHPRDQLRNAAQAIEEAVVGVDVEVDERAHGKSGR